MWLPILAVTGIVTALAGVSSGQTPQADEAARIQRGYQIAPVSLHLRGRDRALVGLGSYIVNAQAGCNDCHTNPPYAEGGDPFMGQPKRVNTAGYLAGGQHFGPFVSRNITPHENGLPAGLTFPQFKNVMRTGHDPDLEHPQISPLLQVMPWPVYQNMTDRDLRAIYEYLRSIPSIETDEE
jgi:cytochrome c1